MSVSEALAKVNTLAALEAQGNENFHHDVLQAIRELQLAVETPIETTSRFNFQVSNGNSRILVTIYWILIWFSQDSSQYLHPNCD